ncbi:glycerol-3-phosphate ABC transporter substrate-binding protein [Ketogulonicigenium robustum]|uniref:sn-glycerol-3-phosphate-binding periplasmic protein UgpB n=1 Tax=Ketogulonicigenium robustum TaxID=92947 RepID=A0A1W6P0F5_9RHOB|nr:ABC transporter substrate-binding protein [Ketogulonicigenium robustum]ARO14893.1 glycerol-3-phosphate ABC transporter substrate-binding protein [Ketogulonicigenium robustum]
MHRRSVLLGALASSVAALPFSRAMAQSNTSIRFYNYNLATAGIGAEATLKMLARFGSENRSVTVEGVGVPVSELMGRVQADMVAGMGPDVAQLAFTGLSYARDYLGAVALEDAVPAEELEAHLAGMIPNGARLGKLDGKTYALPYVFSTPVLFYNADIFRAAGLDPDTPPKTWEDVRQAAETIQTATDKTGLLTGIFGTTAGDWLYQGIVRSAGGQLMSDDRKTLTFASAEVIEGLSFLRSVAKSGAMQPVFDTGAIEAMASGSVGMYLQTSAVQNSLLRGSAGKWELRSASMPAFPGHDPMPSNSGSGLVMMTRDPAKQRAAWELMKFLTSDWAYTVITSEIGYLPLRPNAIESEEFLAPWIRENPLILPNLDQLTRLEPTVPYPGPNYAQIMQMVNGAAELAVFGPSDDVAGILTEAQRQAQSLMP